MKVIIGYTDTITECECCGKTDLKGTFCLEIDGVELYYGSVCAFKHGITIEDQKKVKSIFKKEQKERVLYELHILPLQNELKEKLISGFTTDYDNLSDLAKKIYHQIEAEYKRVIDLKMKKYKISKSYV